MWNICLSMAKIFINFRQEARALFEFSIQLYIHKEYQHIA